MSENNNYEHGNAINFLSLPDKCNYSSNTEERTNHVSTRN